MTVLFVTPQHASGGQDTPDAPKDEEDDERLVEDETGDGLQVERPEEGAQGVVGAEGGRESITLTSRFIEADVTPGRTGDETAEDEAPQQP
ncbi:MAG: hypothetical protein WBG41_13520 [Acidimicrobiales bacterium]